jgi:hypothetical protein
MRLLLKFGVYVLLITALLAATIWQTRRANHQAWLDYQAAAAARGDRLDFEAYIPPPIPDAENFTATPAIAAWFDYTVDPVTKKRLWRGDDPKKLKEFLHQLLFPTTNGAPRASSITNSVRENLPAWAAHMTRQSNLATADVRTAASAILAHIATNAALRAELVAALPRKNIRFSTHFEEKPTWSMGVPHVGTVMALSNVNRLHALASLASDDSVSAIEDILVNLRLSRGLLQEPGLLFPLSAARVVHVTLSPILEGLWDHRYSESQLELVQREIAALDFLEGNRHAFLGERGIWLEVFGAIDGDPTLITTLGKDPAPAGLWLLVKLGKHLGWSDVARRKYCIAMDSNVLIHVDSRTRSWNSAELDRAEKELERQPLPVNPYELIGRMNLNMISKPCQRFAQAQAFTDLARTACALERHRLAHGVFPASLTNITALLEGPLPHDVITGAPLTYRLEPDGSFLLYQCGWDGLNHGGDPAHDWVWPSKLKDPAPLSPP